MMRNEEWFYLGIALLTLAMIVGVTGIIVMWTETDLLFGIGSTVLMLILFFLAGKTHDKF